jgi:hypothetical protein
VKSADFDEAAEMRLKDLLSIFHTTTPDEVSVASLSRYLP